MRKRDMDSQAEKERYNLYGFEKGIKHERKTKGKVNRI
jgi:hypothetical protein